MKPSLGGGRRRHSARRARSPKQQRGLDGSLRRVAAGARPAVLNEAMDRLAAGMGTRAQALEAFRKIDKDSSAGVEATELKLALKFLNIHFNTKQAETVMLHLDADGDGTVSVDEFLSLVWGNKLKLLRRKFGAAAYSIGGIDAEKLFRHYDKNHSNELEFEEFRLAVRRDVGITERDVPDAELRDMFQFLDSDGSGTIGMDEFKHLLPEQESLHAMRLRYLSTSGQAFNRILKSAEQRRENMMYLFHRFDANGSGGLDKQEFRQAMLGLEVVLTSVELDEIIEELDGEGNGFVTPQEFNDRLRLAKKDRRAAEGTSIAAGIAIDSVCQRGCEPEPEPEPELELSSELEEPSNSEWHAGGGLSSKHAKEGLTVRLQHTPAMQGAIVKKAGNSVEVDFTQSGGLSKWVPLAELQQVTMCDGGRRGTEGLGKHIADLEADGLRKDRQISRLQRQVDHWKDKAAKLTIEETKKFEQKESELNQQVDHWRGQAAKAAAAAEEAKRVRRRAGSLRHASSKDRRNRRAVMAAVAQVGTDLQYAAEELRADPEVVLTAVAQCPDGSVLRYASRELREDDEFLAVAKQPLSALIELREAECRLRAGQVARADQQVREVDIRSAVPRSYGDLASKATIKQIEQAASKRLAEQTRLTEAAEFRATTAERKLRATLENFSRDSEEVTKPPKTELLEMEKRLTTERQATKSARRRMEAASQSASKACRELSVALESNALLEEDLAYTKRKLRAEEKEFKLAKSAFKKMIAALEEDLATKSKLVEQSQDKTKFQKSVVEALNHDVAQVQVQWVGSLHRAIEAGDLSTVRELLNSGNGARAAVTAQVDGTLAPMPLHRAIYKGDLDIFRRLTAEFTKAELPAVFNMQDSYSGFTSLHVAVEYGHADIVDAIIRAGCDTTIQNRRGKTAWDHARLLTGCDLVACVDPVFHMHAGGKHAQSQLELELAQQSDRHQAVETYSDPVEIDTRSLHSWGLDTFSNWTQLSASDDQDGIFEKAYVVERVFPAMQIGQTMYNTMVLKVARQNCKSTYLHDEVRNLARLTRNPECPSNIVQVLGIVYGRAQRDDPETFMMAIESCPFSLADVILPEGTLAQHYSTEFVLEQAQGIAWGLSYCHARGLLHLDLKLEHIGLKQTGGPSDGPAFTAKIGGLINRAKIDTDGCPIDVDVSSASDVVFGATDILQFGTMFVDMLTRKRAHSRGLQILTDTNIPPMLRMLIEACWCPKSIERLTSEQIHRLLHSIDARVWIAETMQQTSHGLDAHGQVCSDHSTHAAETISPGSTSTLRPLSLLDSEPNPTSRLLGVLGVLESEMVNYPYEMELLRRKLEGLRHRNERKLEEQLIAERQLNQLNRDRAVRAATVALTAELQGKKKQLDEVRQNSNRSIDLLKATILDLGGFSEPELAKLVPPLDTQVDDTSFTDVASMRQPSTACTDEFDRLYSRYSSQLDTDGHHQVGKSQLADDAHESTVRSTKGQRQARLPVADPDSPPRRDPQRTWSRRSTSLHGRRQNSRALLDSLTSLASGAEEPSVSCDQESETTVLVTCPDGCASGDTVTFSIDADDGEVEMDVVVPSGVTAGDEFEIQFDSSS